MAYNTEFGPDYTFPAAVLALITSHDLVDLSWHNDTCPSVGITAAEYSDNAKLYIDAEDADKRECPADGRFIVTTADRYDVAYCGDDLIEALRVLRLETTKGDIAAAIEAAKPKEPEPPAPVTEFAVGQRYTYTMRDFWSGNYGKDSGYQTTVLVIEIASLHASRFDWTRVETVSVTNPCPGDAFRVATGGGISYDGAREMLAGGTLRPAEDPRDATRDDLDGPTDYDYDYEE